MKKVIINRRDTEEKIFEGYLPRVPKKTEMVFLGKDCYRVVEVFSWLRKPESQLDHYTPWYEIDVIE